MYIFNRIIKLKSPYFYFLQYPPQLRDKSLWLWLLKNINFGQHCDMGHRTNDIIFGHREIEKPIISYCELLDFWIGFDSLTPYCFSFLLGDTFKGVQRNPRILINLREMVMGADWFWEYFHHLLFIFLFYFFIDLF